MVFSRTYSNDRVLYVPFVSVNRKCREGFFACDQTRCFNASIKCNGKNECSDGSDESDCPCWDDQWVRCNSSGRCIMKTSLCDGINDCNDGSDELNCEDESK